MMRVRMGACRVPGMVGCLIVLLIVVVLFVLVPWPLWPLLIVALIVVGLIAAALGLFKGVIGAVRGRRD
jgi:hypothetical protein